MFTEDDRLLHSTGWWSAADGRPAASDDGGDENALRELA